MSLSETQEEDWDMEASTLESLPPPREEFIAEASTALTQLYSKRIYSPLQSEDPPRERGEGSLAP